MSRTTITIAPASAVADRLTRRIAISAGGERRHAIVVTAGAQPRNAFVDVAERADHQYGQGDASARRSSVGFVRRNVTMRRQCSDDRLGSVRIVFDGKNFGPDAASLPRAGASC